MPWFGIARSCSLTAFKTAPISVSPERRGMSSTTGVTVVNHPTVRDTSTPSSTSSRPWPSSATPTAALPVHSDSVSPSAASNTSLICVR